MCVTLFFFKTLLNEAKLFLEQSSLTLPSLEDIYSLRFSQVEFSLLNLLFPLYLQVVFYFEFQILYGVPMKGWIQRHLKNKFKVRVYLPYGPQWYEYSIRRLKENPNIAKYVAKSIFSKRDY